MYEAQYALEVLDESAELIRDLTKDSDTYNVGNVLNALHYLRKARQQVVKLVEREYMHRS